MHTGRMLGHINNGGKGLQEKCLKEKDIALRIIVTGRWQERSKQYGGVGAIALGPTRHRLCSTGEDLTGLGRWVWVRYKGKGEHHLRVVGAYPPNPKGTGEHMVHAQHQKSLLNKDNKREPQVAFNQDLAKQIKKWELLGGQIVIALDANDNLRVGSVKRMMGRQGLREALLTRHKDLPTVPTFHRNSDGKPIDGIFVTKGITL
jgi:hypothetical protein